jgi:hypothetical protein
MKRSLLFVSSVAVCCLFAGRSNANPTSFSFTCITSNDPISAAAAVQFTGTLEQYGSTRVLLTLSNAATGVESSITDIYFDDAAHCLSQMTVLNNYGVAFSSGAYPSNLPGASYADPDFVTRYSADSDYPTISKGVQPGESISFRFTGSYDSVEQSLNNGQLRVGIYVQGFTGLCSESFVSFVPPLNPAIPAPGALLLAATGLGLVRWFRCRRAL